MNYELAKQLKEAGFKAKTTTGGYFDQDGESKYYPIPELSELIEACGEKCVVWGNNAGIVYDESAGTITYEVFQSGKTPLEAVAKLWLTLNQKLDQ